MIPIGFSKEGWDEIDCGERCSTRSTVGTQQEGSSSPYLMSRYTPDELHQDLFVARDASLAPLLVLGQHDDGRYDMIGWRLHVSSPRPFVRACMVGTVVYWWSTDVCAPPCTGWSDGALLRSRSRRSIE